MRNKAQSVFSRCSSRVEDFISSVNYCHVTITRCNKEPIRFDHNFDWIVLSFPSNHIYITVAWGNELKCKRWKKPNLYKTICNLVQINGMRFNDTLYNISLGSEVKRFIVVLLEKLTFLFYKLFSTFRCHHLLFDFMTEVNSQYFALYVSVFLEYTVFFPAYLQTICRRYFKSYTWKYNQRFKIKQFLLSNKRREEQIANKNKI